MTGIKERIVNMDTKKLKDVSMALLFISGVWQVAYFLINPYYYSAFDTLGLIGGVVIAICAILTVKKNTMHQHIIFCVMSVAFSLPYILFLNSFALLETVISFVVAGILIFLAVTKPNRYYFLLCSCVLVMIPIGIIGAISVGYLYIPIITLITFTLGAVLGITYIKHTELVDYIFTADREEKAAALMKKELADKKSYLKNAVIKKYDDAWNSVYAISPVIKSNEKNYVQKLSDAKSGYLTLWLSFDESNYYLSNNLPSAGSVLSQAIDSIKAMDEAELYETSLESRNMIDYTVVPFSKIIFFNEKGEQHTEQYVTSTGGGVNLGGAIVGGLLFGDAGAIVGGRAKNVVSTINKTVDNRYVLFKYYDEKGSIITKKLPYEALDVLVEVTPEKEHSLLQVSKAPQERTLQSPQIEGNKTTTMDKIKELKEMLDAGLISQDEFNEQKARMLREM